MRIVSLLPSATEIIALLGAEEMLVGRSHECDHPPGLDAPVLTAPRAAWVPDSGATPADVDRRVRDHLSAGEPLYTLNVDRLVSLQPDLILTQDLCSVCSIDLPAVRAAASKLAARTGRPPRVIALNPHTIEAVLDDVLRIGEAISRQQRARECVAHLRDRLWRAHEHVDPYDDGPTLAFLEWTDPPFIAGHWTAQLVERAGARHPLNHTCAPRDAGAAAGMQAAWRAAGPARRVAPRELVESAPRRLIIAPCGLDLDSAAAAARDLARQGWFADLPAVQQGAVAIVDGNQMFSRPGPRLVEAFQWLVGWLHDRPALIPPGFPWRPFP